ncbi:MAG: class I SAM-dependent methyltransferase [Planctomycetota bacterium]
MAKQEEVFFEIVDVLPRGGPGSEAYTRQAYGMLPPLEKPRILDIGCGPGAATIELARLAGGEVIGLDNHRPYVDRLAKRIEEEGFSDRVRAVNCSMFEMDFPEENFDLIWAESSIYFMGLERGLREWRRFLRPDGFLVVSEMTVLQPKLPRELRHYWKTNYPAIQTVRQNIRSILSCGYVSLWNFPLPEDAWWANYYGPVEKRIRELRRKYGEDPEALKAFEEFGVEIEMYRKYHAWYGSVYFAMQRKDAE